MSRIIQILIRNHVFFLFCILSLISLNIFISNNFVAESNFSKKMTEIRSRFFFIEKEIKDYFLLNNENKELLAANAKLFKENEKLTKHLECTNNLLLRQIQLDSTIMQVKILKNSWNKKQNFITINKGAIDGLKKNMGIVNHNNNLVGITHTVSAHFSTVISIININLMISAKIKSSGHYGTLSWNGQNPDIVQLYDIPKHVNLKIGDTIVTSGYSNIFPEDIPIGKITNYQQEKNTNFLSITVDLFVDFTSIQFGYIINSDFKSERELIEKKLSN